MRVVATSIFLLLTIFLHGQSFEGVIVYENSYTSKDPRIKDEQFNEMMGTRQEYYIKDGSYKSVLNGTFSQFQLYKNVDNKLYWKFASLDTLYWIDGKSNKDEIVNLEFLNQKEEILGHECAAILIESRGGKTTYFFTNKYSVDPSLYQGHKYGNWYALLEKSKSVPLKLVMETPQFKLVSVAVEIKQTTLSTDDFKLPLGLPIKQNPF